MAQTGIWGTRYLTRHYRKPYFLTEYGVGHHGGWVTEDPTGIIVHNGLWGPDERQRRHRHAMGWGGWIDTQDMYHYWKPVADIVAGVPFAQRDWRPVQVERFAFRDTGRAPYYADVFVEGWPRNYSYTLCPPQRPEVFTIDAEASCARRRACRRCSGVRERCTLSATFLSTVPSSFTCPRSRSPATRFCAWRWMASRRSPKRCLGARESPWEYWRAFPVPRAGRQPPARGRQLRRRRPDHRLRTAALPAS